VDVAVEPEFRHQGALDQGRGCRTRRLATMDE
jgi:hypothetical protein